MTGKSKYQAFRQDAYPALKTFLEQVIAAAEQTHSDGLVTMLHYQMGWTGAGAGKKAEGKQIRPMLVLLAAQAAGGSWRDALPAASAVELLHNFSLIHDDIEDESDFRRGRPTLWKRWGIPQAINTGDAMFSLANLALTQLAKNYSPDLTLKATHLFQQTCLQLTKGQHLDIHFETITEVSLDAYWDMVAGKTAALLSFSMEVGALCAGAPSAVQSACRDFGRDLGLAFQVQDDLLGIWGEKEVSGKSASADLISKKKTLPIIYGLGQPGRFKDRWAAGPIAPGDIPALRVELEAAGAYDYAKNYADQLTQDALRNLNKAELTGNAGEALQELADQLLRRKY